MHIIKAHPQDDPIKFIYKIESKDKPSLYGYLDAEDFCEESKGSGGFIELAWEDAYRV